MFVSKLSLRKKYQQIRAAITPREREAASQAAATLFASLSLFKRHQVFAAYLAFKDEFDVALLMEKLWEAKKTCYVPVLPEQRGADKKPQKLEFVRYESGDALHRNRFGILEPINQTEKISVEALEVVITPLLAFDIHGNRLGTGGGYYDRTFDFVQKTKSPLMIGVGFAAQEAAALPAEPWDVKLSGVITEQRFIAVD